METVVEQFTVIISWPVTCYAGPGSDFLDLWLVEECGLSPLFSIRCSVYSA